LQLGPITPNGAVAFAVILIGATMVMPGLHGLMILAVLALAFALFETRRGAIMALKRTIALVLPLAAFLAVVWIGVVGRSPAEIAAGTAGTRAAASLHVALVCTRLFVVVLTIQSATLCFAGSTPLQFIRALHAPIVLKRLLVLTLSLIETFRFAVDRAHTALIASGLLTRRASRRNLVNAWMLVQTVWLSGITIVIGRLRDKWPIEGTLNLLDGRLGEARKRIFGGRDGTWLALAAVTTVLAAWVA
jgi:hypothetical protein